MNAKGWVLGGLALWMLSGACKSTPPPPPPPPPPPETNCIATATQELTGDRNAGLKALMGCVKEKDVDDVQRLFKPAWVQAFNGHKQGLQVMALVLAARSDTFTDDLEGLRRGGVEIMSVRQAVDDPAAALEKHVLGRGVVAATDDTSIRFIELIDAADARGVTEGTIHIKVTKSARVPVRMGDELVFLMKVAEVGTDETTDRTTVSGELVSQVVFRKSGAKL